MQKNPLTNIKLFLFDLDGTLIDTAPDFLTSLNNVLAENNRDLVHLDNIRQSIGQLETMTSIDREDLDEIRSKVEKIETKIQLIEKYIRTSNRQ